MANTGNINENNVSNLTDNQLSRMTASELDEVLDVLKEIERRTGGLKDEQRKVAASAGMYRRELEKSGKAVKENLSGLEKTEIVLNSLADIGTGLFRVAKGMAEPWGKADQAAFDFGKTLGGNVAAVERLRDESIKFGANQHIGEKYNASIAEMIKLQQDFSKTVGRNLQLSNNQRETLLATSKLMGQNTNEFAKRLENMGIGLEKSGDLAAKMFNEASKSGISFEKYSESVTQNLTKVQSYGFKNGVEGLTAMAKKAAEVNLSINEAFKVADKIQSGGIQEAIKMGANLQVLGGSFAQMGDPMGMLYQGLNDMEGLQDRMIKMFSGLGEFENGQVKISGANRLRVNAAAQAMGVSSDEMFNMINRQAVRSRVEDQAKNVAALRGDEELRELVLNTATLNKEGQAVVNVNGREKTLDEMTSADKKYLQDLQKTESEDIKDIAQILRGYTDVQEGFQKEMENQRANMFSAIGNGVKEIVKFAGESTALLHTLITIQTISSVVGAVSGGVKRIGNISKGTRAAASATRTATTAAQTAGAATTAAQTTRAATTATRTLADAGKGSIFKYGTGRAATRLATKIGGKTGLKIAQGVGKVASKAGGAVAGGAFAALEYAMNGSWKGSRADKNKAIGGTIGATIGGASSMIPVIGPFIAPGLAILGQMFGEKIGGAITKHQDKKRNEARAAAEKELKGDELKAFKNLKGDYSAKEIEKLTKALKDGTIEKNELNKGLLKKIQKSGDAELIEQFGDEGMQNKFQKAIGKMSAKVENGEMSVENANINIANPTMAGAGETEYYASGGKLNGPSDINGPGMPIQGSNIVVGGGEYVVNAEATKRNEALLNRINSGETIKMAGGGIVPKIKNIVPDILKSPLAPLKVLEGPARKAMDFAKDMLMPKMEVAPIKLDVSGTIKLDAGGQQVDLNAIVNNPAFLTQITQMIERRLADNINGGNFKELKKNKQHTF